MILEAELRLALGIVEVAAVEYERLRHLGLARDRVDLTSWRIRPEGVRTTLAAVLEDERDGVGEALAGLLLRSALAISPWDLRAVGDVPVSVAFEDGGKLVLHGCLPAGVSRVSEKYPVERVEVTQGTERGQGVAY